MYTIRMGGFNYPSGWLAPAVTGFCAPDIAGLLKPLGYATGQFGKNHSGDRDEMLPTNHGFDEFYGNLYHLNAEEEPESLGQSGRWMSEYADAMIDHDKNVGTVLDKIDALGIGDNTFVMYSTDNGPHMNCWPDAAMTPFRSEKNSNWEGAYRVPAMVRYPGKIKPGTVSNEIISHLDWLPTILAMAGEPQIKEKLLTGHKAIGRDYKVHLDGYNFLPYLTG